MQVYRVYVMELDVPIDKLQEISWSNLRTIISVVNKNNVATLLPEALTLANADLRERRSQESLWESLSPLMQKKNRSDTS